MSFLLKGQFKATRGTQVIKWNFNKKTTEEHNELLIEFLNRLGFSNEDSVEIHLKHDITNHTIGAAKVVNQIKAEGRRNLVLQIGQSLSYVQTKNEHGYGVFFAMSGFRKGENTKTRVHAVDYDKGKEKKVFKKLEDAQQQKLQWEKQIGTEFEEIVLKPIMKSKESDEIAAYSVTAHRIQERIDHYKRQFLNEFKKELETALVVETKNGLHAYWVIRKGDKNRFKAIQQAMNLKFGTDSTITDIARILRLPYFFHLKNINQPFFVEVIHWGKKDESGEWITYTQDELIKFLNIKPSEEKKQSVKVPKTPSDKATKSKGEETKTESNIVEKSDLNLREEINVSLSRNTLSFIEFIEEIKQFPLCDFFTNKEFSSTKNNFCCHFHEDERPSATLMDMTEGEQLYRCFSDNCEKEYRSVIDIVMHIFKVNFIEAVQILAEKVGVEIELSKFQQQKIQEMNLNLNWIRKNLECRNSKLSKYPELYTYISKPMKKILKEMIIQVQTYAVKEEWTYEGMPVFFVPYDYLAEEIGITKKYVMRYVNLLTLLGLIIKMHHSEVPDTLFKKFEGVKAVNYYCLPVFENVASMATKTVIRIKEINFLKSKINFEYVASGFGIEVAKKIFPNDHKVTSIIKPVEKVTNRKVRKKVEEAFLFLENTSKEAIRKKKYIKEELLLDKARKQSFNIFSKELKHTTERTLLENELKSIYESFKVHFTKEGYKRVTLSKKIAKELGLKQSQKPGERIYIWIKSIK